MLADTLVQPRNPVVDYVTQYSGITKAQLDGCTTTHAQAQVRRGCPIVDRSVD